MTKLSEKTVTSWDGNPLTLLKPRRKITGMSAILLPFQSNGQIDWKGFESHVLRTLEAGLAPAVNMDTGYANLIDEQTRKSVLERTQNLCQGRDFVAGAFVASQPGSPFDAQGYGKGIDQICDHDGIPVIFQSFGLTELHDDQLIDAYQDMGRRAGRMIAFELGTMFAPFGKIYTLEVYGALMQIPECLGAKHSSLSRQLEWKRLHLRNQLRPEFMVMTGNDLAIDMVMYGSDYLLGLSTFDPAAFALRDQYWQTGDPRFYELNDVLQYLGQFAFRPSVPAYKHTAAQFLHWRGQIASSLTHPQSATRPDSDLEILKNIDHQLQQAFQA